MSSLPKLPADREQDGVQLAPEELQLRRVVCSGCDKVLQEGEPGAPTSQGLCIRCKKAARA